MNLNFLIMKIKQSETVIIKRSEINFAPYNPRTESKEVVQSLIKNFKKVGFLGGIIWNARTGNLVGGHKRVQAMDIINKYSDGNDYEIKVEKVDIDDKTEKSQNYYLNNKKHQAKTDYEKLAVMIEEIDLDIAEIDEEDITVIEAVVPDFYFGNNEQVLQDIAELNKTTEDRKKEIRDLKKTFKENVGLKNLPTHFTIVFDDYEEKAQFLSGLGIGEDKTIIKGKEFVQLL